MNKLFEIASRVDTPLALGGIIVVALFLIYKFVLKKDIFPQLTKIHSYKLLNKIVDSFFALAVIAILLGFVAYIIVHVAPTRIDKIESKEMSFPEALIPSETLIFEITPPKFPSPVEKQKYSSTSVNKDFSVIHFTVEEKEPFPIIKFTLMNGTEDTQVINRLKVIIHDYSSALVAETQPKVLKPIALWNIELLSSKGTFQYKPSDPILIPSNDAATISLRLFHTYESEHFSPHNVSHYTLKFVFICTSGFEAETSFFMLQNSDVLTE